MTENESQPKKGSDILPIDDLRIDYHALSRFALRQHISIVEAGEQLRSRLAASILVKYVESGWAPPRKDRKKAKGGMPVYVFKDAQDKTLRFVVRKNDKGRYYLATIIKVDRHIRHPRKR